MQKKERMTLQESNSQSDRSFSHGDNPGILKRLSELHTVERIRGRLPYATDKRGR